MIHFYGAPGSSAGRTHLMLEECGARYEYHRILLRDPASKAELLKLNPGGRIPFLIDGNVRLQESIAIDFYLAEKYAPQLWSTSIEERALLTMWSLWSITNLQDAVMDVMYHSFVLPAAKRHADIVEDGMLRTQQLLDELEAALTGLYVVGQRFTVADVHVASVVNLADRGGAGTIGQRTAAWLNGVRARPAYQRVSAAG
jgi:glutathione S-transferase